MNFHLPASDISRATTFYAEVFGWRFEDASASGVPYFVSSANGGGPGIDAAITLKSATVPAPVPTIDVDDIDDAMARIALRGGRQASVRAIEGVGRFGYAIDCEGNVIALLERTRATAE